MPTKTVVELDLVGYGAISAMLEDGIDVGTVAQLNDQIQTFVDIGLRAAGVDRNGVVHQTTGDGAILIFDSPAAAHVFAAAIHAATRDHNRLKHSAIGKRMFRIGIATGDIHLQIRPQGGHEIAGTVIARAVRLEAGAPPGGVLVDGPTYDGLTPDQQRCYGEPEWIKGKRDEKFDARRCIMNPDVVPIPNADPPGAAPRRAEPDRDQPKSIPEELLRELLQQARIAEAPANLDLAITKGLVGVDRILREVDADAKAGLELKHVLAVATEAIGHGAGIYNHSMAGRVGCARIYHRAAMGLKNLVLPLKAAGSQTPRGAYLAIEWLERIVSARPEVDAETADELAWELRFAFDAMPLIPQFDSVTNAVGAAASRTDAEPALCELLRQILENSLNLRDAQVTAYLLQHTATVLLQHPAANRALTRNREPLRKLLDEQPHITRQNASELVRRLSMGLIHFCQNVEAGEPEPQRKGRRWWPFG